MGDRMYIADLHIHSRFSMATSKQLTLPHLAGWAGCKGIHVLGTGDFTHPVWQKELKENLELDEESGFYRLKGEPQRPVTEREIPGQRPTLFCLQTEISSIYKRGGRSRRIHNCVYFPTLEDVERFSKKLAAIGNIESDGRPILGLDSRDLLEIVLETSERGVLVPAHIWTPWYSLFGSKSGFDAIEDCFGDLTDHIFALETGLSSDPAMNRLVSALDRFCLISNSDAHSGANLGREANLFHGNPTYDGMFNALREAAKRPEKKAHDEHFMGTLEIYPEEGKYHLDGHRACGVVMTPEESAAVGNICPVCRKPLTIGVLHRVWELADRREETHLENEPGVYPIIPLPTVLAQIHGLPAQSRKVEPLFRAALERLGSEFDILAGLEIDEIADHDSVLAEAVRRIREGEIGLRGGYDGEFGTISIFSKEELAELRPGLLPGARKSRKSPGKKGLSLVGGVGDAAPEGRLSHLPDQDFLRRREEERSRDERNAEGASAGPTGSSSGGKADDGNIVLDEAQERACGHHGAPLLVLAGPGSGKTRLLTERMARLLDAGVPASDIVALTFSRRAGEEIAERLSLRAARKNAGALPFCGTFHSLAWSIIKERNPKAQLLSDEETNALLLAAFRGLHPALDEKEVRSLVFRLSLARERCESLDEPMAAVFAAFQARKREGARLRLDFCDLLEMAAKEGLGISPRHVLVDEIQDLSLLQVRVLQKLLPPSGEGLFGIGDPDQSIYAFRGSLSDIVPTLKGIWPTMEVTSLATSFRSSQKILDLACLAMRERPASGHLRAARSLDATLLFFEAPNQAMEEQWVAEQVARLLGPSSHTLLDLAENAQTEHFAPSDIAPSDIAILVRVKAQMPSLAKALARRGIPVQAPALDLFWQDEAVAKVLDFMRERLAGSEGFGLAAMAGLGESTLGPKELEGLFVEKGLAEKEVFATAAWRALVKRFAALGSWERLFEDVCWQKETDLLRRKAESVRLLTMHAAKGLEFRAVFIPGFNDGLVPHDREILRGRAESLSQAELEEERRLLYVALTRASEAVHLSCSLERSLHGRGLALAPSRFFREIEGLFAKRRRVAKEVRKYVAQSLLP